MRSCRLVVQDRAVCQKFYVVNIVIFYLELGSFAKGSCADDTNGSTTIAQSTRIVSRSFHLLDQINSRGTPLVMASAGQTVATAVHNKSGNIYVSLSIDNEAMDQACGSCTPPRPWLVNLAPLEASRRLIMKTLVILPPARNPSSSDSESWTAAVTVIDCGGDNVADVFRRFSSVRTDLDIHHRH